MKHYAASFTRRNVRAYLAGLLSYMLIMGQMAPLALAASPSAPRVSPPADVARASTGGASSLRAAPAPLAAPMPFAAVITTTKVDSYAGQPMPALPGATITYTITINNTSATDAATNLTLTDTVDPNTTIVPGSAVATPIATDETYNVLGNVRIQPNAAGGLLANDNNPNTGNNSGLTASGPNTGPTNGQATVNADGSFTYNPNPGFTGTDSFTYTITSANGTDTATAHFNIGNGAGSTTGAVLWFVDDNAAPGGDGRLTSPFNCYTGASVPAVSTCFSDTAADDPADFIFLHAGVYTGGYTLLQNQLLLGQGASTTVAGITGLTVPSHSDALPVLNNTPNTVEITTTLPASNAVNLAAGNNNTLRGFRVGNTTGAKVASTASGFGTLTTSEVELGGNGQALNLDSGTLAATFTSISSTTSGGQGINLDQIAGSLTVTGGTSVTDPVTQCILVTASTANMSFGNTSCSDATDGISLGNNSAGTRTFGTLGVTNGTGIAFFHNNGGGTTSVTGQTTITNPGGKGIDIQDSTTAVTFANTTVNGSAGTGVELGGAGDANSGAVTFADLDIAPDANVRAFQAVDNTGQITTTSGTISNTATATTFEIDGPAGRTPLSMVLDSISGDGGANGIVIMDVSGTLTNGTTSLLNNAGIGLLVLNSTATFGFGNTTVNSSAGDGVDLSNNTGNITFADLDIAPDANVRGLDAQNNSGTITTTSGDINTTGAPAVFIDGPAGRTPLAMVLTNVDSTNSGTTGVEIREASGSFTVNDPGVATNIVNPTGVGLSLINNTATFNFGNTNAAGSGGTGVVLGTAGNGNTGNITFADLDIAPDSGQRGLHAVDNSGTITTTTGTLNAPNSSAVTITRSSSTTPLNVTFLSVSADGGGLSGIVLTNTSGTFTVTGDGGGANNGTGGSISNKVGAGNLAAVILNNVTNVRLRRMNLNDNDGSGVFGTTVNGFELTRCNINNNGDSASPDESGVELANLTGTNSAGTNPTSITNTSINNSFEAQIQVTNTTGTLTSLDMSGNTITDNGTTGVTANLMTFNVPVGGNATMTLNLTSGTFTGAAPNTASGIQCDHSGAGGLLTCNVTGGTYTNNNVAIE
ncbi:MAG: Ig-like domain-containing protein, partial [Pyrinomonadaceae bacterium]